MSCVVFTRNRQRRLRVDRQLLVGIARKLLADLESPLATLGVILVTDSQMSDYNKQFHHRPGPTDILTFAYDAVGELVISADHVETNARRFRTTFARELALYLVHGILHLHGYDDQTPAQRRRMRAAEQRTLRQLRYQFDLHRLVRSTTIAAR